MNDDILLDYLISKNPGNTFIYNDLITSKSLLKEVLVRGFQIHNSNPDFSRSFGKGGYERTPYDCHRIGFGYGDGESFGYGRHLVLGDGYGDINEESCREVIKDTNGFAELPTIL